MVTFIKLARISKKIIFLLVLLFLIFAKAASASDLVESHFFIEKDFDLSGRSKIESVLVKNYPSFYFYVGKDWWEAQSQVGKDKILRNIDSLSIEFKNNIYPKLTSVFGYERKPGIDHDEKITLFFHPMNNNEGGYFRSADGYEKLLLPISNEREILYLSVDLLTDKKLKIALAHEFVHLITFNQKNINFGVEEDVWLNEARAEYSSTILGYDDQFDSSNLQSRVRDFIESSSNSLTEWRGTKYDYASASLFAHYMVDHYGIGVLSDSLKSKYVGIESINYALENSGYKDRFSEIFTNWTIANVLNNCSFDQKYCYLDKNLSNVKIIPTVNFLPVSGNTSLSGINITKNWSGNWQKFVGGNGDLKLKFLGTNNLNFVVPCLLEDKNGKYFIKFLVVDQNQRASMDILNFGVDYKSLIMIPTLQSKTSGFDGPEPSYNFSYNVTIGSEVSLEDQLLIQQLSEQIESLKKQLSELKIKLGIVDSDNSYCPSIYSNLYFGMANNSDVRCLQAFLKNQGQEVYPEALVTGNFANLTKAAVIRFQEKYASEILIPLGLSAGTGYVGPSTRAKINQLLYVS